MSAEVRDDYLDSLEELAVNSRPIIKTLTEIAQENVEDAKAIAEAVEMHVFRCSPNHKLPALYLVDSICKNIGEPYASLFVTRIVGIFTNAFGTAPENVRIKLNELFKTWTIPLPSTGQPVFPHEILRQIDDFLMRQQMAQMPAIPSPGLAQAPDMSQSRPRLNQSALMVEINRFRQQLESDQKDQFNERQLSLLVRLEAQISGVTDPKLLPQIQSDLDEMKYSRDQHLSRPPASSNTRRGNGGANQNGNMRRDNRRNNGSSKDRDGGGRDQRDRKSKGNGGVGKITGTNNVPLGSRKGRSPQPTDLEVAAMAQNAIDNGAAASSSRDEIASTALDLAAACEQPAPITLIDQLYSSGLPLQCSTCGYRFHNTEEGRAAKEAEMDWHFRANKDIREGHSRNRCWFLVIAHWVAYRDEDEVFGLGSSLTTGADILGVGGSSNQANKDDAAPVDLEKEREKYTEVPIDSNVVCPVCQEPHDTSWSEEAENWVWMNTVEVGGYFFHATCYADPLNQQLVASLLEQKV